MKPSRAFFLFFSLIPLSVGCGDSTALPRIDLVSALENADPGDVVRLGAHRYEGTFVVPAGVELRGEPGAQIIAKEGNLVALTLIPSKEGDRPTKVQGLVVKSEKLAIASEGEGLVEIQDVTIETPTGIGVFLNGVTALLKESRLMGVVDGPESESLMVGEVYGSDSVSIIGLAIVNADVQIEKVDIRGYIGFGAVAYQSAIRWKEGKIENIVGVGFLNEAGTASLEGVHFKEGLQSKDILGKRNGFGLISSTDATTDTSNVTIESMMGMGFLSHESLSGTHVGLSVLDNTSYGIHVQGKEALESIKSSIGSSIRFEGLSSVGNAMAGVSLVNAGRVAIVGDSLISDTLAYGAQISVDDFVLGHGIQLAEGTTELTMDGVILLDNQVVGMMLDGAESILQARDVYVGLADKECDDSDSTCFAIHAQNGASKEGFNAGVTVGPGFVELEPGAVLPKTAKESMPSVAKIADWSPAKESLVGKEIEVSPSGIRF